MLDRLSRTKRNLALGTLGALVIWFSWTVRSVLNPVILGYLLAYIVHPLVQKVELQGWSRRAAVNLIFVVTGVVGSVVGLGVWFQGERLVLEVVNSNVDVFERVEDRINVFVGDHPDWFEFLSEDEPAPPDEDAPPEETPTPGVEDGEPGADQVAAPKIRLRDLLLTLWGSLSEGDEEGQTGKAALRGAGGVLNVLANLFGSVMAFATLILLLPIYTYFLLFELERIHGFVRRYLPKHERERLSRVGRQMGEVIASFFRGRLTICFLKGGLISLGLAIVGVDYALFLGMMSGFLSLIPFVGPMIGFVFAFLIGLQQEEAALFGTLLRTGIVFVAAELCEGYIFIPKILGDSLGLHPVVVLVSVFAGGAALGMFGFLIALPLTAALVIVVREMVLPAMAAFADEDPRDDGPEAEVEAEPAT